MSVRRVVVVPCFNEEKRLDAERFADLTRAGVELLFVDDGSRDATRALIESMAARDPRVRVLILDVNRGKGEAVRAGLLAARADGADVLGYFDADLAAPPSEMLRVLDAINDDVDVALGSRMRTLGRRVERKAIRHYMGRVFATFASLALDEAVYDTQCGVKAFRATAALDDALKEPFTSRWVFDVELLARLLDETPADRFVEIPLMEWRHIAGSNVGPSAVLRSAFDLAKIAKIARARRARRARGRAAALR